MPEPGPPEPDKPDIPPWIEALADGRLCDPFDDPEDGEFAPLTPGDICDRRRWAKQLKLAAWDNQVAPLAVLMAHLVRCSATVPGPLARLSFARDEENLTGLNLYLMIAGPPGAGKDEACAAAERQGLIAVNPPPEMLTRRQAKFQGRDEQDVWEPWTEHGGWWGHDHRDPIALTTGAGVLAAYCDMDPLTERAVQRRWCRWAKVEEAEVMSGRTSRDYTLFPVLRTMWGRGDAGMDNATAHLRRRVTGTALGVVVLAQPTPDAAGLVLSERGTTAHGTRERFLVAAARDATRPTAGELPPGRGYGKITFGPSIDPGTVIRAEPDLVAAAAEVKDLLGRGAPMPPWYSLIDHGQHTVMLWLRLAALIALHDRPAHDGPHTVKMADAQYAALLMRASRVARDDTVGDIVIAAAESRDEKAESEGKARSKRDLTRDDRLDTSLEKAKDDFEERVWLWIRERVGEGPVTRRRVQQAGPRPTKAHMGLEPAHGATRLRGFAVAALIEAGRLTVDDSGALTIVDTSDDDDEEGEAE